MAPCVRGAPARRPHCWRDVGLLAEAEAEGQGHLGTASLYISGNRHQQLWLSHNSVNQLPIVYFYKLITFLSKKINAALKFTNNITLDI